MLGKPLSLAQRDYTKRKPRELFPPRCAACCRAQRGPSTTLADFSRARDSQITFSVTHGWSAFWRGRPWLAGRRIGETSSDVGSNRFWIGWVTKAAAATSLRP